MSISNKHCKFERNQAIIFEQQPFEVFQVFQIYRHLCRTVKSIEHMAYNCNIVIGWYKIKLHLQGGANLDTRCTSVNRNM